MQHKFIIQCLFFIILLVAGILMRLFANAPYLAGILTGIGGIMLPCMYVGKKVADKAAARMDKRMRDIILNK